MLRAERRVGRGAEGVRERGAVPALLVVNGLLLLLLGLVTFAPSAGAQGRPRGDYTMVAGGMNGSNSGGVYVVDVVTRELVALTYDQTPKELIGVGYRDLAADEAVIAQGPGR